MYLYLYTAFWNIIVFSVVTNFFFCLENRFFTNIGTSTLYRIHDEDDESQKALINNPHRVTKMKVLLAKQ